MQRDELTWMPAWQLRDLMASKQISPVEVTEHFLGRIEEHDPVLHAFRHVDATGARERAKEAQEQILRGEDLGPLHGVPLAVKEHIAVAGMPILILGVGDKTARFDDVGVSRLRQAGAVIVGTNTMMGTQAAAAGQYNWGAEARSPWDTARVPGWSSSGGAAATAAGLLPVAVGSDGGGSTRLPAAYSGLVGVHPTAGLIPTFNYAAQRRGNPTGTIGPLARTVVDAAIVLGAMAGPDGRDFDCLQGTPPDYRTELGRGVDGLRLGWTDDFGYAAMYAFDESPRVISHVRDASKGFAALGATIEPLDETWEDFYPGLQGTMQLFGGDPVGRDQWTSAIDLRERNWRRFRAVFAEHDLIVSPTSQLLAPTVEDWAARWAGQGPVPFPHGAFAPHYTSHTHMFNWLGFPAVSVPVGFVDGLPVGMQVVGWPGSDAKVLRAAHAFLSATPREEHPAGW
jgi:aspartyl-tRNA(Asn)/glutamyl-tRNA(Gln) amidotransferase subunit A